MDEEPMFTPVESQALAKLLEAADRVVKNWETSSLQFAVRDLDLALAHFGLGTTRRETDGLPPQHPS